MEQLPTGLSDSEKEAARSRIAALQTELDELRAWERHWVDADRQKADRIAGEIKELKKQIGDLSDLIEHLV